MIFSNLQGNPSFLEEGLCELKLVFLPPLFSPLNQMRSKLSANQIETSFLDLQIHSTNEAISSLWLWGWGSSMGGGGF